MNDRFALLSLALLLACGPAAAEQSGARDPMHDAAQINARLGVEYMKQGQLATAREKIEKALQQNARDPGVQIAAGLLYEQLREVDTAERHYRLALKYDASNPEAQNSLGAFFCRNGQPKKGEEVFLQAARNPLYRTPEVAYTNAGVCARQAGRLDQAEEYLRLAVSQRNPYAEALLQMANVSFERGNYLQARAFLQRYLERTPGTAGVLLLGYQVETALAATDAANEYAARLKSRFPDSPEARILDGQAQKETE
jgi:type IV pilus assembly protein PilF